MTASAPRTDFQRISLSSRSGARSASTRFMRSEAWAPGASSRFLARMSTRAGRTAYGVGSGFAAKAPKSGVAAASYWLMGGRPRSSSIVRRTPEVV